MNIKKIHIGIKYMILISIFILGQIFLAAVNSNLREKSDGYIRFSAQFVRQIKLDRTNSSRERDFHAIWKERHDFILAECAKLRNIKFIKNIETKFVGKDKRFSQQIELKSFLLHPRKQILYYWNQNLDEAIWGNILNQTDGLRRSHPESILALQEAMAFYQNIILGKERNILIFCFNIQLIN